MADLTGSEHFKKLGFDDPDNVGASEYRAIYDCIESAFDTGDAEFGEWIADDPKSFAVAMLGEFIEHANAMLKLVSDGSEKVNA